jgi:glycosyltransferase involved in cell wall biosynthesis
MKVLVISPRFHPYVGGVERVVKSIYEMLVKKGYDVTVCSLATSFRLLGSQKIRGVLDKKYIIFGPYYLPPPWFLKNIIDHYDIIHIHNIHALTAITGLFPVKGKLVISPYYHGKGHTKIANFFWTFYKPIAKKIFSNADAIVVNSNAQRKLLAHDFQVPLQKTYLLYDGVDVNGIQNAIPFNVSEKIILYVGRLEYYKYVHLGILALKYLPLEYKLVIIGRGTYENKLREITVANNLQDRVIFLGYQPDNIVWGWLKTASVFIQLSRVESFCMACIEALAAGTPIVANDDGLGLRETISLYPQEILVYRVDEEPIKELAKKIMLASEMKPVKADVSIFSWERIAERMDRTYRKILSENSITYTIDDGYEK